jgi:hypothetical protein
MSTKDEVKTFAAIQGLYCCHGRTGQLVNLFDYEALEKQRDELKDMLGEALVLVKAGAEFAGDAAQASGISAKMEHRIYEHECKCDTFATKASALLRNNESNSLSIRDAIDAARAAQSAPNEGRKS